MEPQNRRSCYPRMTFKVNIYIFGLTKCTIYREKNVPVFVPVFLYTVTVLIFQIKRKFYFKRKMVYLPRYFFFYFFESAKNLGLSDDAKWRKKRG